MKDLQTGYEKLHEAGEIDPNKYLWLRAKIFPPGSSLAPQSHAKNNVFFRDRALGWTSYNLKVTVIQQARCWESTLSNRTLH